MIRCKTKEEYLPGLMEHKTFKASVEYYVHHISAILDWFGNRGLVCEERDFDNWCYDGYFLYVQPSHEGEKPFGTRSDVFSVILLSLEFEIYEEMDYKDSPFARKI